MEDEDSRCILLQGLEYLARREASAASGNFPASNMEFFEGGAGETFFAEKSFPRKFPLCCQSFFFQASQAASSARSILFPVFSIVSLNTSH
jgi:hypothetical protein